MKVKVGDEWFGATKDRPIMVQLNDRDKANIRDMDEGIYRYAEFSPGDPRPVKEREAWMMEEKP